MHNILIVDDEYLSRNKISFLLNYEQYGFRIIGEATNGKEAVEFLKTHPVNAVFTDVAMPEMDGIELAKYIKGNFPDIKVVIMSNYSDFDYIRQAFSANAVDYILKHTLTAESMHEILKALDDKITSSELPSSYLKSLREEEQYRNKIINAVTAEDSGFSPVNALVLLLKIDSDKLRTPIYSPQEIDMLYQNICNLVSQTIKDVGNYVIFLNSDMIVSYLPFDPDMSEVDIMHIINLYIQQITAAVYKFFNFNVLWGISCLSSEEYSLNHCYKEAQAMLEHKPLIGKRKPYPALDSSAFTLSINQEKQILSALSDLNMDQLNSYLEDIFSTLNPNSTPEILIGDLVSIAVKFCSDYDIPFPDIPSPESATDSNMRLKWCKDMFSRVIGDYLKKKNIQRHSRYTQSVIAYIEKNYSKNISLKDIAKHIGITEQHLSTVFKDETGKTLLNYLTEYRIDKAKELLEKDDINLKQLYSEVGFNSYNYFFTVFKKTVGRTPETYRKEHSKH